MLVFNAIVLFVAALAGGLVIFLFPKLKEQHFKLLLTFGGAYLFSVTMIHILPELFSEHKHSHVGIFLLLGFFLQLILEFFSGGIEHGHIHHQPNNHNSLISSILLLTALGTHAFLEGMLLVHPSSSHAHGDSHTLLIGIVLHKIPAAFALMSIFLHKNDKRRIALVLLFVFAVSSPLGMILSNFFYTIDMLSHEVMEVLFALVAGSFLHISTTIFFETSPNHRFNAKRLIITFLGAVLAVLLEFML